MFMFTEIRKKDIENTIKGWKMIKLPGRLEEEQMELLKIRNIITKNFKLDI